MAASERFPHIRQDLGADEISAIMNKSAEYLADLGLTWEELRGKRILEIGSGIPLLAYGAKIHGIDITFLDNNPNRAGVGGPGVAVSRSPSLERGMWSSFPTSSDSLVRGDVISLDPTKFQDGHFDLVISRAAPPTTGLNSESEVNQVLMQISRVLKPGGGARFYPARMFHSPEFSADNSLDQVSAVNLFRPHFSSVEVGTFSSGSRPPSRFFVAKK